jgi:hypothetical protein
MWKTTHSCPAALNAQIGSQKLKRLAGMLLAFPIIVTMTVVWIYFAYWRTDPLIHFIHMIWVLGFWMTGTVAMFAFIIPARLKLGLPIPILLFAFIALSLAIYFTPLSRFTDLFPSQTGWFLPASIGSLSVLTSDLFVLRFRNKIS